MRCNPLTISKGHSRYLLRCDGLLKQREDLAREVFESAFREYGLPYAIRTERDLATFSGAPSRSIPFHRAFSAPIQGRFDSATQCRPPRRHCPRRTGTVLVPA